MTATTNTKENIVTDTIEETVSPMGDTAETTETPEPTEMPANRPKSVIAEPAEAVQSPTPEEATSPNREAAKYRRQAREAEAERDTLRGELTAARTEILRTAVTGYKIGADLFNGAALDDAGIDTDAIFTDGKLDTGKLEAEMSALQQSRPYMFTRPRFGNIAPREGRAVNTGERRDGWKLAFSPGTDD